MHRRNYGPPARASKKRVERLRDLAGTAAIAMVRHAGRWGVAAAFLVIAGCAAFHAG